MTAPATVGDSTVLQNRISTPDAGQTDVPRSIVSVLPEQGSVGGAVLLTLDKLGVTQRVTPSFLSTSVKDPKAARALLDYLIIACGRARL